MSLRVAFIGFRHGHIYGLHNLIQERKDIEIVAACEELAPAREDALERGVAITHDNYETMLREVDCDVIACGDYYGIRGARLIRAMEAGRHVLGDKPLCTRIEELERIETLSKTKQLRVGCMLDLPGGAPYQKLHDMIQGDAVGEVHTIAFLGQHPLLYGKRPDWYFEEGKHGGTLNDLAIHAFDLIPWATGRTFARVTAARVWNAKLPRHPHFQTGAVCMLELDNGGAVLGDVSYLSSDSNGYSMPAYWRFTISGSEGVIETSCNDNKVSLWRHDTEDVVEESLDDRQPGGYFEGFLADLEGQPEPGLPDTARVLRSSRVALVVQRAAETGACHVAI